MLAVAVVVVFIIIIIIITSSIILPKVSNATMFSVVIFLLLLSWLTKLPNFPDNSGSMKAQEGFQLVTYSILFHHPLCYR